MKKIHLLFLSLLISASLFANVTEAQTFSINANSNLDTTLLMVKGRVVDDKGAPIAFASIRAGKRSNLVFTNDKGEFEMSLAKGSELFFGSAGFEDKEINVSASELLIQLDRVADILDIDNSSSQVVLNGDITIDNRKARTLDSINAADLVMQRDVAIPGNENKLSLPEFVSAGGMVSIGLQLLKDGNYKYQLVDKTGKVVYVKAIRIESRQRMMNLAIPVIAVGDYDFELIQVETGKRISRHLAVR